MSKSASDMQAEATADRLSRSPVTDTGASTILSIEESRDATWCSALAERLKPEPFRTQKEVAVLGILAERVGINEVS